MYMSLCVTLTEFRANGNWGYNVPVHPGLSLLKSQPKNCHVSMCDLHTTSKLHKLRMSLQYTVQITDNLNGLLVLHSCEMQKEFTNSYLYFAHTCTHV